MVRFEVNDPVVVDQIGGRTLSGRVTSVNTDNTYTILYDDGSRERVGEHLVQLHMPNTPNLAKAGSDLFQAAMGGSGGGPRLGNSTRRTSLARERSDEVLNGWYIDAERCVHHTYGTTRPIEEFKGTQVYTNDRRSYQLGTPDRTFYRFMQDQGMRYDSRRPLDEGISRLVRAHQVMRATKEFDLIKDALKKVSVDCGIRAGTREDDAVRRCLVDVNELKRHLTASFNK